MHHNSFSNIVSCTASKKFLTIYGTRRFITAFTRVRQLSQFLGTPFQAIPPTAIQCIFCVQIYGWESIINQLILVRQRDAN